MFDFLNPVNLVKDVVNDVETLAGDISSGNLMGVVKDMTQLASELGSSGMSSVLESVGHAVGIPDTVIDAIEAGAGAATGDIGAMLKGATGGIAEGLQPGHTDYVPPQTISAASCGYATPVASGPAPAPAQSEKLQMLEYLQAHFDEFEQSSPIIFHRGDNRIGTEEFQAIAASDTASAEMKRCARYFLDNPDAYDQIAQSNGGIVPQDIQIAIEDTRASDSDGCSTTSGTTSTTDVSDPWTPDPGCDLSGDIASIINDPSMSLEEKIMAVLTKLENSTDDEIKDDMNQLAAAQKHNEKVKGDSSASQGDVQKAADDVSNVTMKLQQAVERRKNLAELMTNIDKAFNDMAMAAIQNIGR